MTTQVRTGFQRVNPSLANNVSSGRDKLSQEGKCRICGWAHRDALGQPVTTDRLTRHHLVPQAWFLRRKEELKILRNANANIVPLCDTCHSIVDGREPVLKLKKRAALRQALYPNEIAFILQIRGRPWFDHHYPLNP